MAAINDKRSTTERPPQAPPHFTPGKAKKNAAKIQPIPATAQAVSSSNSNGAANPAQGLKTQPASPAQTTVGSSRDLDDAPLEIDLQILKAMELIEQENFPSALIYLNRAIVNVPAERLAECFSLRGYVHLKNLEFAKSESDCSEAIGQDWQDAQTYAWRAAARGEQNKWRLAFDDLDRACELAGPQRDQYLDLMDSYAATASEYFRERIKLGEDSADLFFDRGWIYFRCGNYAKAERDFKLATNQEPAHPWASVGLAKLMFEQSKSPLSRLPEVIDLASAGTHGDQACERNALAIRAQAKIKLGRIGSAQRDLGRLIDLADHEPRRLVECCRLLGQLGDHVKAIDGLTAVLADSPQHHLAYLVRGDSYREIKNYALAIKDYTKYLRFFPESANALTQRASVYLATKQFEAAHDDLDRAQELESTSHEAFLIRAQVFLEQEQFDQALTECEKAVRLDNQTAATFAVMAETYQKLCDYSRAIEEYSRSIELADTNELKAHYLYHRGVAFYETENFENAYRDFKKSCALRPNHSGGWIWKAATCSKIEKWSDAILGLQQAISVRPSASGQYQALGKPVAERAVTYFDHLQQRGHKTLDIPRQRGLAYQFLGRSAEAIRDYSVVLEQEPNDFETLVRRGRAYAKAGRHEEAIGDFTRAIRKDASNHGARYLRAISHAAEGRTDHARSDLIKAIKVDSNHPRYHILLAEILQSEGELVKAIASLTKAIQRDPTDPVTYRKRATLYLQGQSFVNAISDYTHSLELYPSQIEILVQRGFAYLKADQPKAALEDFELALTHNDKLARAYAGRAAILVQQQRHEYSLIWLTKAIHRFDDPRDLAEILFARGKAFYQMGRNSPAVADFSAVIELIRSDRKTVAAARLARAIANVHAGKTEKGLKDFMRLKKAWPNDSAVAAAITWLNDPTSERPAILNDPRKFQRPMRPSVKRTGVKLVESESRWENQPPHDTWIVRSADKKEYGPVQYDLLKTWINDGRIDVGMKVLRADWSKWKRAESIFEELYPFVNDPNLVENFPGISISP